MALQMALVVIYMPFIVHVSKPASSVTDLTQCSTGKGSWSIREKQVFLVFHIRNAPEPFTNEYLSRAAVDEN